MSYHFHISPVELKKVSNAQFNAMIDVLNEVAESSK